MKPNIKLLYVATISVALAISCKGSARFSSRPDPNTSTSGTVGSVKATNGALPVGETRPHKEDTVRNH